MQTSRPAAASSEAATLTVWDPLVRIVHWTVVIGCILNLFILEDEPHEIVGYVVAGAMALRIVWGFVGSKYARFSDFVRGPSTVIAYLADNIRGRAPRYIGHNPAASWMMLALILLVIAVSITGYMMGTDRFWGEEWLEELHEWIGNAILILALIHAGAAIVESWRHRENLVWAMITGRKRA
jgi:cytochrome b